MKMADRIRVLLFGDELLNPADFVAEGALVLWGSAPGLAIEGRFYG